MVNIVRSKQRCVVYENDGRRKATDRLTFGERRDGGLPLAVAGRAEEEQDSFMDRFTDDVQAIIDLEEDIRLCGSHRRGTTWLDDRKRELAWRYQSLLRLWPILPGKGAHRRLRVDDETAE